MDNLQISVNLPFNCKTVYVFITFQTKLNFFGPRPRADQKNLGHTLEKLIINLCFMQEMQLSWKIFSAGRTKDLGGPDLAPGRTLPIPDITHLEFNSVVASSAYKHIIDLYALPLM